MGRLFGTDGVRGVANSELTAELAYKLGQAGAYVLTQETKHKAKILVGKDTRVSSDMLEAALCAGICSIGAEAVLLGVVPTPAVAHLTRQYGADAGVVISASHNSMEYNGIKFFNAQGYKLSDETEEKIEAIILDNAETLEYPTGSGVGKITYKFDAKDDYIDFAKSTVDVRLDGLKIAVDCANGASSFVAAPIFEQLGATVYVMNDEPNGTNINAGCGSTHIDGLQKFTVKVGADIGLAFDGDADRVLAVDENGAVVDGDKILAVCGLDMKNRGVLAGNTIVATVMSNLGLFVMAKNHQIHVAQTKVGDRYVLEELAQKQYSLGGEQSGHIIFFDYNTTGDAAVTALQLISVLMRSGKRLSELAAVMEVLPQVLINARVKSENKDAYLNDEAIRREIEGIEQTFCGNGRVLIRPSGTEPLVRVMIEGADLDLITEKAKVLASLIENNLN